MTTKPIILCGAALLCCVSASADAVQKPRLHKNDPRVWEFTYTPDDIYKAWSAPGSVLLIRFAPDELIIKAQAADTETIQDGHTDNLLTLKFAGCVLPEPVFVLTRKMTPPEEMRTYSFSVETIPVICPKAVPQEGPAPDAKIANAAYSDGPRPLPSSDAVPNLQHLAHPNDLAEGGAIPYMITFKYPSDEKAKREAVAEKEAKRFATRQTRKILGDAVAGNGATTGFENNHYYGRGDADLKPCLPSPDRPRGCGPYDDGNTTKLLFPGDTPVPAVTKLPTETANCGDSGGEAVADYAMHGNLMVINGTAPGWCLRRDKRVYQIRNRSYNQVGYPTGTGTVSPYVERVVKEP